MLNACCLAQLARDLPYDRCVQRRMGQRCENTFEEVL
ncbi:MAG TPA: hypothetical protein DEF41_14150 [Desulfovibrio sp.]|uniref:Uncharacterized protein n=1 Tax=Nitratidesulfovibrio vulgaris (strain ATCC 29579 / DSM 644 / CCUG 34227 / NCIMB 8303 / VKM B-1760 / Hildenborough) TaxID=882 RepID=Q72CQ3_NITV2|nr:hypothetical protein DVU_1230 [Nitratidesulfovibrio vulgaris str. Hildenborough]HBW17228.1 hypothetical protein [Desulfovibrio sp.]